MVISKIWKLLGDSISRYQNVFWTLKQLILKRECMYVCISQVGKSQQPLLIHKVNSYLNAKSFQVLIHLLKCF